MKNDEDISNRHKNYIEGLPLATFETTKHQNIESNGWKKVEILEFTLV